ncbi:MAG: hypothetical protein GEU90_03465 [Gemmatimonas sp.]|nr:hypothetical protein [Gemmatimonas sp.]
MSVPKVGLAELNHGKDTVVKAASRTYDRLSPSRRRRARRRSAMTGIGAAALALPMGLWLGRKLVSSRYDQSPTTSFS